MIIVIFVTLDYNSFQRTLIFASFLEVGVLSLTGPIEYRFRPVSLSILWHPCRLYRSSCLLSNLNDPFSNFSGCSLSYFTTTASIKKLFNDSVGGWLHLNLAFKIILIENCSLFLFKFYSKRNLKHLNRFWTGRTQIFKKWKNKCSFTSWFLWEAPAILRPRLK